MEELGSSKRGEIRCPQQTPTRAEDHVLAGSSGRYAGGQSSSGETVGTTLYDQS